MHINLYFEYKQLIQCQMVATHEPLCWYGYSHTVLFCELLHFYAAAFISTNEDLKGSNTWKHAHYQPNDCCRLRIPNERKPESGFAT